jgi:hypothetical protein
VRALFTVIILDIKYAPGDYRAVYVQLWFSAVGNLWNKIFHNIAEQIIFPRICAAGLKLTRSSTSTGRRPPRAGSPIARIYP